MSSANTPVSTLRVVLEVTLTVAKEKDKHDLQLRNHGKHEHLFGSKHGKKKKQILRVS